MKLQVYENVENTILKFTVNYIYFLAIYLLV